MPLNTGEVLCVEFVDTALAVASLIRNEIIRAFFIC